MAISTAFSLPRLTLPRARMSPLLSLGPLFSLASPTMTSSFRLLSLLRSRLVQMRLLISSLARPLQQVSLKLVHAVHRYTHRYTHIPVHTHTHSLTLSLSHTTKKNTSNSQYVLCLGKQSWLQNVKLRYWLLAAWPCMSISCQHNQNAVFEASPRDFVNGKKHMHNVTHVRSNTLSTHTHPYISLSSFFFLSLSLTHTHRDVIRAWGA